MTVQRAAEVFILVLKNLLNLILKLLIKLFIDNCLNTPEKRNQIIVVVLIFGCSLLKEVAMASKLL